MKNQNSQYMLRHIVQTRCWANDAVVSSVFWEVTLSLDVSGYRQMSLFRDVILQLKASHLESEINSETGRKRT